MFVFCRFYNAKAFGMCVATSFSGASFKLLYCNQGRISDEPFKKASYRLYASLPREKAGFTVKVTLVVCTRIMSSSRCLRMIVS